MGHRRPLTARLYCDLFIELQLEVMFITLYGQLIPVSYVYLTQLFPSYYNIRRHCI